MWSLDGDIPQKLNRANRLDRKCGNIRKVYEEKVQCEVRTMLGLLWIGHNT